MNTLTTLKAWILICSTVVTSSATIEHASSHHDVTHHGDSIPQKKHQNSIVPFGIQIPGHVLSAQDVACISADPNIFEIMNKAQESCNGTDMRCTFYHFINHGHQNIGTLDIDKELFDNLLMKFDNWLLSPENIEKDDVPLDVKTKDSSLDTASINVNSNERQIENSTNVSETERLYTNQGIHIGKVNHNTNESDDDKIINNNHIKKKNETHHRNHHHKWKNGNHIELVPVYNNDHRYFEVFLPKDKETGKPRTIYVEVDRDHNEFVLLDEEIDKKLNGIKPIKIELDELSQIADTAFNNVAKSSNKNHHIHSDYDDERVMISDVNTNSVVSDDITNFNIDVGESTQNILNPSISNINANQQLIPDNTTGNVKKIENICKNLAVPNKYINQAQFYVESQLDNIADDHLELLENTNETDTRQTGLNEKTPLDTIEFNQNNTSIDLDSDNIECSLENVDVPCENANDNSTENYEPFTEDENETFDGGDFIELGENNDTSIDIDFDATHNFSKLHLNEPILQDEKPMQENKLKSTPYLHTEPKLTSSLTARIPNYTVSQLDAVPSENRQRPTFLQDHSPQPGIPSPPYTTVPLFGKDLSKVLETDSHLQSYFPAYAIDIPADASQNTPLNSNLDPSIISYNFPLNSDFGHQTNRLKMSNIFPSPPVECDVKLNKGSKYSPLNFDFSWLPSYNRIEELRLPCDANPLARESIMSLPELQNKQVTDSICPEPSLSDHTIPVEEPSLFQTVPSLSVNIQEPFLTTEPYHLEADALLPPKPVLLSKLYLPKSNTDLDRISTTYQLSESPLSVVPDSFKDAVNTPCSMQQIPLYLQPNKPNLDLGCIKYSPFDNNSKEPMFPCSPCKSITSFANPNLKTPCFIPSYLEPLLPAAPLQPASKIPTLDSFPISLHQSYPYLNGDYPRETKPISLLPNTEFSRLDPLLLGPAFVPNTLNCQNLLNNIPHLPYTILPDQNVRNYPPIVNNYFTQSAVLQPNQMLKPLLSKTVSSSVSDQPCSIKNILELTPPSYAPFSQVYTPPIQMNAASALERDLQSLSFKYGIPLSKILNSLVTEISDAHSKTSSQTLEVPYSNIVHDCSLIIKPVLSKTDTVLDDENRSNYEESPLDSSLIGPHLGQKNSLMLESNDSQSYTVLSESTVLPSSQYSFENEPTKVLKDNSLIGPHLSTLSTSNFVLSDKNRNENEVLLSESEIYNLSLPLDSSLIGPHLEIGSPPIVVDSINSQSVILTSHTEVPITISSQIKPKLNIQNQPTNVLLDSSLIGSHLPPLSAVDEIQTINGMIPIETDLTDLSLLDSALIHTQEDLVNQLDQSKMLQHENTAVSLSAAVPSIKLNKTTEYLPSNITEAEFILESDSSRLIPLDSSLVGPGLKLENSPIIVNAAEDKIVSAISLDSLQNTDNKVEELESIILPSSLLPTLLKNPVKADSNHKIITQETKNEELDGLSLDTNVELPLTDISIIPFKETDFKIVEPLSELLSLIDDSNMSLLTKDSRTLKHKLKSSELTHVIDSETLLDNSLIGPSILHKLDKPEIPTSLDSSIHLDSSLIGPSVLLETDSREISPIIELVDQLQTSLAATTINQNIKPPEMLSAIDSSIQVESSLIGPALHHEINSKETSTAFDSFDKSLVPSLHETKESSATTLVLNSSQLNSSLIGPSLHQETLEVFRAVDSKDLLDSSLVGSHLSTVPVSNDENQMINEELQPESGFANFVLLDSSLVGPHVDLESVLKQSEISRYKNPESSLTSVINPHVCETTELPCDLVEGVSPPESITLPSICTSDLQELLSKFTNAITKSQLSLSELELCDKLLSSIAKISSVNKNISPSCTEFQTLSESSPITMTTTHEYSPVEPFVKLPPCLNSNYFSTPKTLTESLTHAQGLPQIPVSSYSPFKQMKPLIDHNWHPQPLNFQNILHTSPSFRPVVGNAPVPYISNALIPLTPEDFQPLLDLASNSKVYPQLSIPNMSTPGDAIEPGPEWTTPSNILQLDKNIPFLPKKSSSFLPSNLESTITNSEYNPIVVDDIMFLLDENSCQLLKDMSFLPFSQSSLPPAIPVFEKSETVSPLLFHTVPELNSDYIKTRPLLPISIRYPLVTSSIYNPQICLYNPQNIPDMIQTPNISLCNLQPHSNTPLHSQFSEIIEPTLVTLPTESPKAFLQKLLSKPCVESPIVMSSSSSDTMLQLPTALNELKSVPCQLPPEYFTPISPINTKPLSNMITNPILPMYASPLSLNVSYIDSPLYPLPLLFNPYTARPLTPKYSSLVMPLKITSISDYPYSPTVAHNRPILSEIPYKPSQIYSSPYLPIYASPIPIDTSPGSPKIMNTISPVFYEPSSTPYLSPLPKSLTNLGLPAYSSSLAPISLSALGPTPTGLLSPYLSLDVPKYSYSPLPTPINTLKRPSNVLSPAFMTSESSNIPSFSTPLSLNPIFNLNPQITAQELQPLRQMNSLPISNAVNPFLNTNQRIPLYPNKLPIQRYSAHLTKSSPFSNSQIKENIPCENALESNLLTSPLTEEIPFYDVIEESTCYSNDKDANFYEEPKLKYPLESLSYTLAPEEITEALPNEDFIKQEDITLSESVTNFKPSLQTKLYQLAPEEITEALPNEDFIKQEDITLSEPVTNFEPSLQTKLYQHHRLTPYTPLHGKPLLKTRPAPQLLQPPTLIETIPQIIFDNTPLVPLSRPLKYPISLPASILPSAFLKPLTPLTSAPNFPISSPLCHSHKDTTQSSYYKLPMNVKLQSLSSSPYYSAPSQDMSPQPNDPRELRNIVTPQVTTAFSQIPINEAFVPFSLPIVSLKSQPPISPYILDKNIQLPSTHYEPKSKTLTSLGSIIKQSSIPPIISHIPPFEMPITPQYITPLTPPQNLKKSKPVVFPQCVSSVSPSQITLQDSLLLNEVPIHYQPYIPQPAALTSSINNMFIQTPSRPFDMTTNPQNILKPKSPLSSVQYAVPLFSSPYFTLPQWPTDPNQTQLLPNVQYTTKPQPKLSSDPVHYASPSLSPMYTSLPLETVPKQIINILSTPQYSLPYVPVDDTTIHSSSLGRNPFLNPNFKPIPEVPSHPVPKNIISSPILAPSTSILLSNLTPLDITQEPQNLYSSPITSSARIYSSSLLKPLVKTLPQKSRQYHPHIISSNSQYVSQLPMDSVPQLLPSTSPLLKPLFTTSQNNVPLMPMHISNTNTALPEAFPIEAVPSVTSPDMALSNYLPFNSSNHKYSGPYDSLVSEMPINPSSTIPYIFLKSPFNKHFKSPVSAPTNMPLYLNYDIVEPSPKLPIRANIVKTAKPVKPYQTWPSSTYTTSRPKPPSSIPSATETELIDSTDFIPLSQIKSEPLIAGYSLTDRKATTPNTPSNNPEPDILQLSPNATLLNTEFPTSTYKQLPPLLPTPSYSNQIPQPSPIYLSAQEYKDLTQGLSPTQASSSSPVLSPTNTGPQLVTSPLTGRPSPQIPIYTSPMSITSDNWLQSPTFSKSLPFYKKPLAEKENIQTYLNKYRPANKITPLDVNYYPYEDEYSMIYEEPSELDSRRPVTPLIKSKQHYTEYIEHLETNEENYYDPQSDSVSIDKNQPNSFESKSFTLSLPEIIKGLSIPNYNKIAQKPQRLSQLDHFYANNHIGKRPQVFTVPTYNTLPLTSPINIKSPSTTTFPEILKDFNNIDPKLDTYSLTPNEYYPEIVDSPENKITKYYPQNYLNPCLKYSSQIKSPLNTIELAETSEMTSPDNNIDGIKYSGYQTYQIPSFKFPKTPGNVGVPIQMYSPSVVTYSSANPSKVLQNPSSSHFYRPTEISKPLVPQYQTLIAMTTPLQTKLGLDTLQESPELDEYDLIEDIPISADRINEDNELKTSLINYINKREDVKNNLFSNNAELTIPIGNIAITRKEPYNANTIETNNPSIGLKVWKSNVKIAEAELKLKFKDLSVNNFMPIVNNLDKYDMEEIRKIVKNYIDEKYGKHIEINEPYTIDNKYTVIKDFDFKALDNKYNLLWPTNYV